VATRFNVEAIFKAIDKFSAPIAKMEGRLGKFTRGVKRSMRQASAAAGKFLRGIKKVGRGLLVFGAAAGFAAFKVLSAGADFEQAITNVGAVALMTRKQTAAMEEQAKKLGETTKFTATESAQAMEILMRAGFGVENTMKAVPAVLDAAAASGLEMAEVADITSNALKGFGLDTSEAARVADVLALASSKTNSTMGTLGESLKNVSSTARQLGVPLEDAVAGVALLQDVGLDASVAGSSFNTMLTRMAKPPAKIAKAMKKAGLSFKTAEGDMKTLPEVIETISLLAEKSGGNLNQVGVMAELFGLRGQKAATNLKDLFDRKNGINLGELTKQLNNASGAAKKMAAIRMDTLTGDMTILKSTLEGVKISIFEEAAAPLRSIVQSITEWVRQNKDLIVEGVTDFLVFLRENGPLIINVLTRIARVVGVFSVMAVGVKLLAGAVWVLTAAIAANPIGLFLTAIGLVAFFWEDLVGTWREAQIMLRSLWSTILEGANRISPILGTIVEMIGKILSFNPIGLAARMGNFIFGGGGEEESYTGGLPPPPPSTTPQVTPPGPGGNFVMKEDVNILLRDETGRAEVSSNRPRNSSKLRVASSGAE